MDFKLQSDEIDKLTIAFVEARKQSTPVRKDAKANYGSYVSIGEIKACTNEALLANGLSLTQGRTFAEGLEFVVTKLTHVSGQWQASYVPLFVPENPKNIDQARGSAYSYQRRYELYGLFGILGDDLDPDSVESPTEQPVAKGGEVISDKQLGLLRTLLKAQPEREAKLCAHYKISDLSQLSWRHMNEVVEMLKPKGA